MKAELLSRAAQAHKTSLIGLSLLLCVFLWQALMEAEHTLGVTLVVLVAQLLPFLLVLPGILKERWRSYAWMLLFLNLYFVVVTLRLFQNPDQVSDWMQLIALSIVFTAALLFVRWKRISETF
ncbi:MAG: DUF2069 domain-containing protein [Pseudomonadales bacterium]